MCHVLELSPGEKYTVDNAQSAQGLDNNMQSVLEIKQVMMMMVMMMMMMMMMLMLMMMMIIMIMTMMMMLMMMIQVSHTDWGVYTCRANNSMGEGEAMVVVKSKLNHILRSVRASRLDIFCGYIVYNIALYCCLGFGMGGWDFKMCFAIYFRAPM